MSRKIKFRAWDKYTSKMLEQQEGITGSNSHISFLDFYYDNSKDRNFGSVINDLILMQFTGLLDKNGKEIFENDIIVLSHPCWSVKCKVKYDDQLACYVLESFEKIDKGVRKSFLHIYQEDLNYKVIGNIYQNPELLGGENE
jgi:uncharacterized phage protein (TIGR01671 family)